MPLGVICAINFNNYDLATPGSPIKPILMFPLIITLSGNLIVVPPTSYKSSAFFTSVIPKISGQIELASLFK